MHEPKSSRMAVMVNGQETKRRAAACVLAAVVLAAVGCVPPKVRTYEEVRREFADVVCRLDPGDRSGSDPKTCDPARPVTLADAIGEVLSSEGTDAAVARFLSLRESFYGGNQYDFSASGVNGMGVGFFESGQAEAALRFLQLNVAHYPEWAEGHFTLGRVRMRTGDREGAIESMETALELAPENEMIRRALARAKGGGG